MTIPAPSGVTARRDDETVHAPLPSAHPTAVPDYDVEALAAASSFEIRLPPQRAPLPPDLTVPVRRRASVERAPLRAAFLLSHVDDRMSVADIALTAQIPIAEAIESFVHLADLGAVELRAALGRPSPAADADAEEAKNPPKTPSGLRPKK